MWQKWFIKQKTSGILHFTTLTWIQLGAFESTREKAVFVIFDRFFFRFLASSCSACTDIVSDHKLFLFPWMPAFTRHPICWVMTINTRDIPLQRSKNLDDDTIFAEKMTLWLSFVLGMKNYDSISLSWVSAFHRHPKCWILITNSRDIPLLR